MTGEEARVLNSVTDDGATQREEVNSLLKGTPAVLIQSGVPSNATPSPPSPLLNCCTEQYHDPLLLAKAHA